MEKERRIDQIRVIRVICGSKAVSSRLKDGRHVPGGRLGSVCSRLPYEGVCVLAKAGEWRSIFRMACRS